ncbi:MAG TPA: hypothetical protein DFR83_02280 [Deltaproteobacteria bacterium]|nr:hypothetical protein [Deltaproteobacteria bacterium]
MFDRSVQNELAVVAVIVGAVGCLSGGGDGKDSGVVYGYDSGWSGSGGGGGGGDGDSDVDGGNTVDDGTGTYGLTIEGTCSIGWDIVGYYTGSGFDYRWDAILTVNSGLTDCAGIEDTSGRLVVSSGVATFDDNYIGVASYNTNRVSWFTAGYVAGGGGGSYAYDGNIEW